MGKSLIILYILNGSDYELFLSSLADRNRPSFWNVAFLGYQTMDKVQKSSNPKSYYFGLEVSLLYQTGCHRNAL
jgi:hypothetical protein